jgi:hypothetical protein
MWLVKKFKEKKNSMWNGISIVKKNENHDKLDF